METLSTCRLSKDPQNPKKHKILFSTKDDEKRARKYNAWFTNNFRGTYMTGDLWFPVKLDSICKADVLSDRKIKSSLLGDLGQENSMVIEHIKWMSKIRSAKEHGSMIVYLAREEDAQRLLAEGFMDIYNLTAYTREYVRDSGPLRCYRCQRFGHKATRCTDSIPTCSFCVDRGHDHLSRTKSPPMCANCKDSHGANTPTVSNDRKRRMLLPIVMPKKLKILEANLAKATGPRSVYSTITSLRRSASF